MPKRVQASSSLSRPPHSWKSFPMDLNPSHSPVSIVTETTNSRFVMVFPVAASLEALWDTFSSRSAMPA